MKKLWLGFLFLCVVPLFAEPKMMHFNEAANEEIVIFNKTSKSNAFKVSIHLPQQTIAKVNQWEGIYMDIEEGWVFLVKSPEIEPGKKWKSSSDYDLMQYADGIAIETRSEGKFTYSFKTVHDKLHIYVTNKTESTSVNDDW